MYTQKLSSEKKAEWTDRVEQWSESGLSMAMWCRKNQVSYHKFLYWRDRFRSVNTSNGKLCRNDFIQISTDSPNENLSIVCNDCTILLTSDFDENALIRCLQVWPTEWKRCLVCRTS